jgi:hypothetical protein
VLVSHAQTSPPRGIKAIATMMVVVGVWMAFGTLASPINSYPLPAALWLAGGIAAFGTATAGVRLLQGHVGATRFGMVVLAFWLTSSVAEAAILGLTAFVNPFTVGQTAFLVVALLVLRRSAAND